MAMTRAVYAAAAMALLALSQLAGAARSSTVAFDTHLGNAEVSADGCSSILNDEECKRKTTCFLRQDGNPKCVPAIPENCPGMNSEHCNDVPGLCHWDYSKANNDWKKACFPGPESSPEQPACVLRKSEQKCKEACLWRPKKDLQCAPKEAKYCQGVTGDQCKKETETCHWELQDDWEHACKGGKAQGKPDCQKRGKEDCMTDKKCMFRPKAPKETQCVEALSKNCKGMNHNGCDMFADKCYYDFQKGGEKWEESCFPLASGKSSSTPTTTRKSSSTPTTTRKSGKSSSTPTTTRTSSASGFGPGVAAVLAATAALLA